MNWKHAAIIAGMLAAYMGYRLYFAPAAGTPSAVTGEKGPASANALATAQLAVGAKALAEGAKAEMRGPVRAQERAAAKEQRKG